MVTTVLKRLHQLRKSKIFSPQYIKELLENCSQKFVATTLFYNKLNERCDRFLKILLFNFLLKTFLLFCNSKGSFLTEIIIFEIYKMQNTIYCNKGIQIVSIFLTVKRLFFLIVITFKVRIPWKIQRKKPVSIIITEKQESFYVHCKKKGKCFW